MYLKYIKYILNCLLYVPLANSMVFHIFLYIYSLFLASESDSYNTVNKIYDYLDQLSTYLNLIDIVFNDDAWKNCYRDAYWVGFTLK